MNHMERRRERARLERKIKTKTKVSFESRARNKVEEMWPGGGASCRHEEVFPILSAWPGDFVHPVGMAMEASL